MTLWLALTALWIPVQDTVGVRVQLSHSRAAVGEVVVWDVTVTTPGGRPDDIRLPQLPGGLQIQGTRRFDEYAIRYPGGRIRTTRVEIHVRARRPGRYAIPPVVVSYDGRRFSSRALALEVTESDDAQPFPGFADPDVEGFAREAIGPEAEALLRARVEPDTVWVGQQATLVVDALVSDELRARLRRAPEYLTPSVSGMWTQDLPDVSGTRVEWAGRRRYEVQSFRRAYFPLEARTYVVPEARLVYEARRGFLFTPYTEELETPPLHLVARPLPRTGVPESFTGAVGDFSISATVAPGNLAVGDAALLTVVVRGRGNLKGLPAPRIPDAPVHLDTPTEDAEVDGAGGVVSGTKTFTWVVVPEQAGTVELGPIEYGYFDPDAGEYRVARTGVLTLEIAPADPRRDGAPRAPATLRPLRSTPRPDPFRPLAGLTLLGLALAPLALGAGVLWARRARSRGRLAPSHRALKRRLRERLDELGAEETIGDARFFERLDQTVRDALADRLALPVLRTTSAAGIGAVLERAGVPPTLGSVVRDLLERIARAPFQPAPPGVEERRRLLERVRNTLARVDRVAPTAGSGAGGSVPLLVLLLLPAGLGAQDASSAAPTLGRIAGAYADGRLDDAAATARAYVREHPTDASGWYDYGTVEAARDNRRLASWALLRALALDPRGSDIRHNLDVTGVDDVARRAVTPMLPLRPGETRAGALVAWWLALALGAVALARRSRGWLFAGAVVTATALVLAAFALAPRLLPAVAVPLSSEVALRAAPHLRAPEVDDGLVGVDVLRVVERKHEWLRVRTPDGREGWLERRDVGIIPGA